MSLPRKVLPGTTYLITRSTRNRRFFLAPDDSTVAVIFWFCIAVAAALTGVQVHAVACLSNHIHLVVTDVRGVLPLFTHWLFRHTALCLKLLRGIEENVWSADKPTCTELLTAEAVLEAMAYTLANPATSGLVARSRSWPGAASRPEDLYGNAIEAVVPPVYFSRRWKRHSLRLTVPAALAEFGPAEAVVDLLRGRVREMERAAARKLRDEGRSFLGLDALLETRHTSRPRAPRPGRRGDRRVPTFKAVCRRAMKAAIAELRAFRTAYRDALDRWKAGLEVTFPAGTWWLARFAGVPVAPLA